MDVLEPAPTVGGEDDDFEVFVEHVKAPSADDNFGASGRKLDFGGHHSEEELAVGVRPAGVGIEVVESEIALLAVIAHCGDLERLVGIGVCADSVLEREFICITYRAFCDCPVVRL